MNVIMICLILNCPCSCSQEHSLAVCVWAFAQRTVGNAGYRNAKPCHLLCTSLPAPIDVFPRKNRKLFSLPTTSCLAFLSAVYSTLVFSENMYKSFLNLNWHAIFTEWNKMSPFFNKFFKILKEISFSILIDLNEILWIYKIYIEWNFVNL